MSESDAHPVTSLLEAARAGDANAASQLLPALYKELRRLARKMLAGKPPGQTLQPTALVHEAYLRIVGKDRKDWDGRRQFFATAARAMQDILVEEARRKAALKRGGGRDRVPLEEDALAVEHSDSRILEISDLLEKLEAYDARKADIVRLRFFAGLSVEEAAAVLEISTATAERDLRYIRAWLSRELELRGQKGG